MVAGAAAAGAAAAATAGEVARNVMSGFMAG
jgi:hypothetical protein